MAIKTFRKNYLDKSFSGDISLSDVIARNDMQDIIASTIEANMRSGLQFMKLVKDVQPQLINNTSVLPEKLDKIARQAKRFRSNIDSSSYSEFIKDIQSVRGKLLSDIETGKGNIPLKRAYAKLAKSAESLQAESLEAAIDTAVKKKAMANAFRIASTETNRAYNQGIYDRAVNDPDVEAFEVILGSNENNCEDCVDIAETDNGAGTGVYAVDSVPQLPIHPHCRCSLSPVYELSGGVDQEDIQKYDGDIMSQMDI